MSLHAYSRVWLHLIWGVIDRRALLTKAAALRLSTYFTEYTSEKGIYMKINYVNSDHTHVLIDLPTNLPIAELVQLLKGSSAHWVNENSLVPGKFGWSRGYGVFSVSQSAVGEVAHYIATQEEHHRKRSALEEMKLLIERYGLKWHEERNR